MPPKEPVRTRDRLEEFMSLRRAARRQSQWLAKQQDPDDAAASEEALASGTVEAEAAAATPTVAPWVRVLHSFSDLEATVITKTGRLHIQQRDYFSPRFSTSEEEEQNQRDELEKAAGDVQHLLKELERMVSVGVRPSDPENPDECLCAKNVQKHLSSRLNSLLGGFRDGQQLFMEQLKARDDKVKRFSQHGRAETHRELETEAKVAAYMELGYSQLEITELLQEEERQKEVSQEVQNILASMQELQDMFRDLNAMVVEQGSVLDRIDYNIQQSKQNMSKGRVELNKAREHQKRCSVM
jgi:syntaxin 16